jgi:hypothetical protein
MTAKFTTTPFGVFKTPNAPSSLTRLRDFVAAVALLAGSIEANALVAGSSGDPAMSGLDTDAADTHALCETAFERIAASDATPVDLAIAADHILAVLVNHGEAPHNLAAHPLALVRMARPLARSPLRVKRITAALLGEAARLLSVIVEDAIAEAEAAQADHTLSIHEIIAL